ncbi:MAG: hypothetical protein R3E01_01550 [Pirellulaceae bacterium]|nr:hypothetical protein [Planctomycetales bacterium]
MSDKHDNKRPEVSAEDDGGLRRGSGGSEGGVGLFLFGLALALLGLWLFFDSVVMSTAGHGIFSRMIRAGSGGGELGAIRTTSMGILFVPFFVGVVALFFDARMAWAWGLTIIGLAILIIEILSSISFHLSGKLTHFLLMIGLLASGTGLMLRSYWPMRTAMERVEREQLEAKKR